MEWDLIPTPSPEPPDDGGESRSRMLEDVIDAVAAMGADPVYHSDPYKPSRVDENRRNLQYTSPSPYPMPSPGPYGYDDLIDLIGFGWIDVEDQLHSMIDRFEHALVDAPAKSMKGTCQADGGLHLITYSTVDCDAPPTPVVTTPPPVTTPPVTTPPMMAVVTSTISLGDSLLAALNGCSLLTIGCDPETPVEEITELKAKDIMDSMIDQVLASAEKLDPPTAPDDDAPAVDAPAVGGGKAGGKTDGTPARDVKVKLIQTVRTTLMIPVVKIEHVRSEMEKQVCGVGAAAAAGCKVIVVGGPPGSVRRRRLENAAVEFEIQRELEEDDDLAAPEIDTEAIAAEVEITIVVTKPPTVEALDVVVETTVEADEASALEESVGADLAAAAAETTGVAASEFEVEVTSVYPPSAPPSPPPVPPPSPDDAFVDLEAAIQGLEDVSTGVIIGAVIGGICGCALLIALPIAIFVCCCSAAAKNKRGAAASQKTPPQQVVVVHGDAVTMESKA